MRFPAPDDAAEGEIGGGLLHFSGWLGMHSGRQSVFQEDVSSVFISHFVGSF